MSGNDGGAHRNGFDACQSVSVGEGAVKPSVIVRSIDGHVSQRLIESCLEDIGTQYRQWELQSRRVT